MSRASSPSKQNRERTAEELKSDAEKAFRARQLKAKQDEEAFYDDELTKMREERAHVKDLAGGIMSAIGKFERENSTMMMADISGPDKMDQYISKFNANSKTAYSELMELAASFEVMQTSTDEVNDATGSPSTETAAPAQTTSSFSGETKTETDADVGAEEDFALMDTDAFKGQATLAMSRKFAATAKLNQLFQSGHKEYNQLVMSMADVDDGEASEMQALVPMLNRKIVALTHSLQMSQLKADAVSLQWVTDKQKFHTETLKLQKTLEIVDIKLQVATGKSRFDEQTQRDPNMVRNVVSIAEYNDLKRQMDEKNAELTHMMEASKEVTTAMTALKTRIYETERSQADDKARINGFDRDMKKVLQEKEKLERDLQGADAKAAEQNKAVLEQLETTKQQMLEIKENAKAENIALKETIKSLETSVAGSEKEKGGGGGGGAGGDLVPGLKAVSANLGAFQKTMKQREEDMMKMLAAQQKRLDALKANAVRARDAFENMPAGGGGASRPATSAEAHLRMELAAMQKKQAELMEEKTQLESEVASLADGSSIGSNRSGKNSRRSNRAGSPSSPGSTKNRRGSPRTGTATDGDLTGGEDDGFVTELITDAELESMLDQAMNESGRNSPQRKNRTSKGSKESNEFSTHAKAQMRADMLKKLRIFSNKLIDGLDQDVDEEEEAEAKKKVEGLLRTYSANILEAIDTVSDRVGGILSDLPKGAYNGDDDNDASIISGLSNGSGFGEGDWEVVDGGRSRGADEKAEMDRLRELLSTGGLGSEIGTVRKENFERLRGKGFGGEDVIQLTMMEHYTRFDMHEDDEAEDPQDLFGGIAVVKTVAKPPPLTPISTKKKQTMQLKMMSILKDETMKRVCEETTFAELATFKTNAEVDMRLLRSFSALKAIKFYSEGGNFMDVLTTHRDVVDSLIKMKGGWRGAMAEVKESVTGPDVAATSQTGFWPEFFRVKVLEYYKEILQHERNKFQIKFTALQDEHDMKMVHQLNKFDVQAKQLEEVEQAYVDLKEAKKKPLRSVKAAVEAVISLDIPAAPGTPVSPGSPVMSVATPVPVAPGPPTEKVSTVIAEVKASSPFGSYQVATPTLPPSSLSLMSGDRVIEDGDTVEAVDKEEMVNRKAKAVIQTLASQAEAKKMESEIKRAAEIAEAKKAEDDLPSDDDEDDDARKKRKPRKLTAAEILASRLHPSSDKLVLRIVKGEAEGSVMAELVVHAIDSWKDEFYADALEPLEEAVSVCQGDPQLSLVQDLMDLLYMEIFPPPREVMEVHNKFVDLLLFVDEIHHEEEPGATSAVETEEDKDDVSELGHSEGEADFPEVAAFNAANADALDQEFDRVEEEALAVNELDGKEIVSPAEVSRSDSAGEDVDAAEAADTVAASMDLTSSVATGNLRRSTSMSSGELKEQIDKALKLERQKLAASWAKLERDKASWVSAQAVTTEHHRNFAEKMDSFELDCERKRMELLNLEKEAQARANEALDAEEKLANEQQLIAESIAEARADLAKEREKLEEMKYDHDEDRKTLTAELQCFEIQKKDLAKEWEEFFAAESKTHEELMYDDAAGPTDTYLKKKDGIEEKKIKKGGKPHASTAGSIKIDGPDNVDKSSGVVDARELLPKGMTFSDAVKAQLKDIDTKAENLAKKKNDFESDMREQKLRMQQEKLGNFKTKSDLAKQLNEVRKEKKELEVKVEKLKKDEGLLIIAKNEFQSFKTREEGKMHDMRDKVAQNLALAEKRASEAATELKNSKARAQEAVNVAVAAAGVHEVEAVLPKEAEIKPLTATKDRASPKVASIADDIARGKTEAPSVPVESPKSPKKGLLKKMGSTLRLHTSAENNPDVKAAMEAQKRGDALTPHEEAILRAAKDGNNSGLSDSLSEVLSNVEIVAKLALKRKAKSAAKEAEIKMQRVVVERVEIVVQERVKAAIQLTQADLVDCGTQTVNFAGAPTSARSNESSTHSAQGIQGVVTTTQVGMGTSPVPQLAITSSSLMSVNERPLAGVIENPGDAANAEEQEALMASSKAEPHPLTPPPVLPPGFFLVHCKDRDLEVCPGVTYASFERLPPELLEKVPAHVLYVYRGEGEAYSKGIKRLPQYVARPKIGMEGTECVIIPNSGLDIAPGVRLIIGSKLQEHLELPPDVHVATIARGANLPPGMARVSLDTAINVYSHLIKRLPKGVEMVQSNFTLNLPIGTMIAQDVELVRPPRSVPPLPPYLHFVKRRAGAEMPAFLVPIVQVNKQDSDIYVNAKIAEGCMIAKKPFGLVLGPGQELLHRDPGQPLPTGISTVPLSQYPDGLKENNFRNPYYQMMVKNGLELIQLTPIIDLPDTCCFEGVWFAFPRPAGMRMPIGVALYRYAGAHGHGSAGLLPAYLRPVPMPDIPYGTTLPPTVLAAEMMLDSTCYLPPGTQLQPGLVVLSLDRLRPLEVHVNPKFQEGEKLVRGEAPKLHFHQVICERSEGSKGLPTLVDKGSTSDLPAGLLLAHNMELLCLHVHYEIPAGIKIEPGSKLGLHTQLAPGTILNNELEVLELPYGAYLEPGQQLVQFLVTGQTMLPPGYEQVRYMQSDLDTRRLRAGSYIVSLPKMVKLSSNQELAEAVSVLGVEDEVRRRQGNFEHMREIGMFGATAKNPFDELLVKTGVGELEVIGDDTYSNLPFPAGCVLARRLEKTSQLPFGMSVCRKNLLSAELRKFLANNPGGNSSPEFVAANKNRIMRGLKPRKAQAVEVIQLAPTYSLPVGAELARGLAVLPKPAWLLHACQYQWLELVSESALNLCENGDAWKARRVELRPERIPAEVRAETISLQEAEGHTHDTIVARAAVLTRANTANESVDSVLHTTMSATSNMTGSSQQELDEKTNLEAALLRQHQEGRYLLPADTVLVSIPKFFQVYSWGPNVTGIHAVVQHASHDRSGAALKSKSKSISGAVHVAATLAPGTHTATATASTNEREGKTIPAEIGSASAGGGKNWGPKSPTKKAKESKAPMEHQEYMLPPAHFFIQRVSKNPVRAGFCLGLHPKYSSMQFMFTDLPPGVEIMHLEPSYHLPVGVTISNSYAVRTLQAVAVVATTENAGEHSARSAGNESVESKKPAPAAAEFSNKNSLHVSIHGKPLTGGVQLGLYQQLGPGIVALPHPPGWLSRSNAFLFSDTSACAETNGGFVPKRSFNPLVFVRARGGTSKLHVQLPPGARVHESSAAAVALFFKNSKVNVDFSAESSIVPVPAITAKSSLLDVYSEHGFEVHLIELPTTLPASRELLKDGKPDEKVSKDVSARVAHLDKEAIIVHMDLRNPLQRDPPPAVQEEVLETQETAITVEEDPIEGPIYLKQMVDEFGNSITDEKGKPIWEEFPPELQPYFRDLLPVPEPHVETEEEAKIRMDAEALEAALKRRREEEGEGEEEDIPIPRAEDLLVSLELAQAEIYQLEDTNNKLLTDLKDIRLDRTRKIRRLAVYAFRQQNRDKGFLSLRNDISEKMAEIVKYQSMVQMKNTEARKLVNDKYELRDRMQAQIDVLNKQLAHSIDANEVVREERRNMRAEFALKTRIQAEHMSKLYHDMKTQCRQFVHLVLGNMFLTVDNIIKDAANHALGMNEAVVSLFELTEKAKLYNISAVQNGTNKESKPLLNNFVGPAKHVEHGGSSMSVSSSLSASQAPSDASSVAGSTSAPRGNLSFMQPIMDTRSKGKEDSWRYANIEKNLVKATHQQDIKSQYHQQQPAQRPWESESLVPENERFATRLLLDSVPPSPDAYIINHNTIPLPGTPYSQIEVKEWNQDVDGNSYRSHFKHQGAAMDDKHFEDDMSVLSEESYAVSATYHNGKIIPKRFQGPSVPAQQASLQFSSPQRPSIQDLVSQASMSAGKGNHGKHSDKKRRDPSSAMSVASGSVASSNSYTSYAPSNTTPTRRDTAQQAIVDQSKMELNANREYVGVAAKIALRHNLPVGGKSSSGQLLNPVVLNRTPQGQPILLTAKEAAVEQSRRNNNFARVPSPIVDKRRHPGTNPLNLANANSNVNLIMGMLPADADSVGSRAAAAQSEQFDKGFLLPVNPFLPVVNDIAPSQPKALHAADFSNVMESLERAMGNARLEGVESLSNVSGRVNMFSNSNSHSKQSSPTSLRPAMPMSDDIATLPNNEEDIRPFSGPTSPPELKAPSWQNSPVTHDKKVLVAGSPDNQAGIHGFVPEAAHAQHSETEVRKNSTRELFDSLMQQIQFDAAQKLPDVFMQPLHATTVEGAAGSKHELLENRMLVEANEAIRVWRTRVERSLFEHTANEKQRYLTALYRAETEMQYLIQTRQVLDSKVAQMEGAVAVLNQKQPPAANSASDDAGFASGSSIGGGAQQFHRGAIAANSNAKAEAIAATMREFGLLQRVTDLERNVDRLRTSGSFKTTVEFMRKQGNDAAVLKEVEQCLKFQALICQQRAKREATRVALGNKTQEVLDEGERRAITHLVKALKAQAKSYTLRANGAKVSYDAIMKDVVGDIEAFENAIQNVLPKRAVMALLRWSAEKQGGDKNGITTSMRPHVHNPLHQKEHQFQRFAEGTAAVNPFHEQEQSEQVGQT